MSKDKVDENAPLHEEVSVKFAKDNEPPTDPENGLTNVEVARRQAKYGPNCLVEVKDSWLVRFLKCFWGPMPIMIWISIIIEAVNQNWPDFTVLMVLQTVNGLVSFVEEKNAGDAIEALKNALAPVAQVKREGAWQKIEAKDLCPGDLIMLKIGDVVPADDVLQRGDPLSVDQAALTGESLPVTIWAGGDVKMGSSVKRGETEALVANIGADTFLGRAASLVASVETAGHFQTILFRITLGLLFVSVSLVLVIFFYLVFHGQVAPLSATAVCVVLLVASIPIAMQVVCTSTMAVGSRLLAQKGAIVARLSAIEELAGMSILCSDKTGTLTKNDLVLNEPILFGNMSADELVFWSALAVKKTKGVDRDAIDSVIVNSVPNPDELDPYEQLEFVGFNPTDKRTEGLIRAPEGVERRVIKGAPQVILSMCGNKDEVRDAVNQSVVDLADRGYRPLAVAVTNPENGEMTMEGMLSLFDPPRDDSADTIVRANDHGVSVKMITGDHTLIAKETARRLNMGNNIYSVEVMEQDPDALAKLVLAADGFAEVFPEHKFKIVDILREQGYCVGMTGDGVNDAPALKRADIGIAVEGATEAARSAADIVLTEPGLMTIIDAIMRSRKIFQRMRNYCIYRVACSLQLLLFFFFSVLLVRPATYYPTTTSHAFVLPVTALVLITVLNDGTMITIAYDNVVPGKNPQKWDLTEVMIVSVLLGSVACVGSVLFLIAGVNSAPGLNGTFSTVIGPHCNAAGQCHVLYGELLTAMYLKVSISDFLTVFSARCRRHALSRAPGKALACAFLFATISSSLISVFWFFPPGKGVPMLPLPPKLLGVVWAYCLVFWFIQDQAKLLVYWVINVRRGRVKGVKAAPRHHAKSWVTRTATLMVFATLMCDAMLNTVIVPTVPVYLNSLKVSAVSIGALFAAKPALQLFITPILKSVRDVTGPTMLLTVGTAVQMAATIFYGMSTDYAEFIGARCVQGVASSMVVYAALALLAGIHSTKERAKVMTLAMQGISAGTALGPFFGGLLTHNGGALGRSIPFIVIGFVLLICFMMQMLLMRENDIPWMAHPTPPDAAHNDENTSASAHAASSLLHKDWAGHRRAPTMHKLRRTRNNASYREYEDGRIDRDASHYAPHGLDSILLDKDAARYSSVEEGALLRGEASEMQMTLQGESKSGGYGALPVEEVAKDDQFSEAGAPSTTGSTDSNGSGANSGGCSALLTDKYVVTCWLALMLSTSALTMMEPLVPLLLAVRMKKTIFDTGGVVTLCFLAHIWTSPLAVRLATRTRHSIVVCIGLVVLSGGLAMVHATNLFEVVVVGLAIVGVGVGLIDAPVTMLMGKAAERRAHPDGIFNAQYSALLTGYIVGPVAGTLLQTSYGLETTMLTWLGLLQLCTPLMVAMYLCRAQERRTADMIN